MKLKDKIAIVTGASAGIGRAIAKRYAEEGATVIALARRETLLKELSQEVKDAVGEVIPYKGDVSVDADINGVMDFTVNKFGRLDILVNNAGIMDNFAPVEDVSDELWKNVMAINLDAPFKFMRKAIPIIGKNENVGSIINVSSIGGIRGGTAGATYVASKHGLVGLVKAAGYTCIEKKIRVNAILPGSVASDIENSMKALYPEGTNPAGTQYSFKGMNLVLRGNAITIPGEHLNADTAMGWYLGMDGLPPEEITSKFMSGVDASIAGKVKKGDVLICGRDFGFGKVHGALFTAMRALEIKCIVADSFATQMVQSAMGNGTFLVECPGVLRQVSMGDEVEVDVENAIVKNLTTGEHIQGKPFPEYMLNAMKSGGTMGALVRKAMSRKSSN